MTVSGDGEDGHGVGTRQEDHIVAECSQQLEEQLRAAARAVRDLVEPPAEVHVEQGDEALAARGWTLEETVRQAHRFASSIGALTEDERVLSS